MERAPAATEPGPHASTSHSTLPRSGAAASGGTSSALTATSTSVSPLSSVTRDEPLASGSSPTSTPRCR